MEIEVSKEDYEKLKFMAKLHGLTVDQEFGLVLLRRLKELEPKAYLEAREKADPKVLEVLEDPKRCPECRGPREAIETYKDNDPVDPCFHMVCKNCGMHMRVHGLPS